MKQTPGRRGERRANQLLRTDVQRASTEVVLHAKTARLRNDGTSLTFTSALSKELVPQPVRSLQ